MALSAECHQIAGHVVPQQAPRTDMVNLEIARAPAILATPVISLEDFLAQKVV